MLIKVNVYEKANPQITNVAFNKRWKAVCKKKKTFLMQFISNKQPPFEDESE